MQKLFNQCLLIMLICLSPFSPVMAAEYAGVLNWSNQADLSLPVSGVITEVRAKPGQHVKQGEVLLTLDKRYFEARLMSAKATLARYQPGRDEAKRELERANELYERTVLSQVELEKAKIDFAEKEATYNHARAGHRQASLDLEYSELKAPYELVVIRPRVVKGQTIINQHQAVPLITVADAGSYSVVLMVKPGDAAAIGPGSQVDVTINGSKGKGRVTSLQLSPDGSRIQLEVTITGRLAGDLKVGQSVQVNW